MVWTRGLGAGDTETIPLVHDGVMYTIAPGAIVQALDATTGDLLWEYKRKVPANQAGQARPKALAIYQDVILYTAPDAVVGLDARTGEQRWDTKTDGGRGNTSGGIVVEGMMISRRLLRGQARRLLHLGSRRADRQGSLALPHHARQRRTRRRKLERRRSR